MSRILNRRDLLRRTAIADDGLTWAPARGVVDQSREWQ
jgi:hypothetical protein